MGIIARVQQFTRVTVEGVHVTKVQAAVGDGQILTASHFSAPGDDSHPLVGDWVYLSRGQQTGVYNVTGYVDGGTTGKTASGDKRIYARNEDGDAVAEVWIKNTGEILISNGTASVTLSSGGGIVAQTQGDIDLNGVTVDNTGAMSVPLSLKVAGLELAFHTHAVTTAPGVTGPNNP